MKLSVSHCLVGFASLVAAALTLSAAPAADPPRTKAGAAEGRSPQRVGAESPKQAEDRRALRAKLDIPKGETPPAAVAGAVTMDSLKTMIENLGYEPKVGNYASGDKYMVVSVSRGTWTFSITMDLSPDKSVIWLNAYLGEVKEPEKVQAAAVLKLVEAENQVWPAYFTYSTQAKTLYIYRPLKNVDVKPALLRSTLEAFMTNIESSAAVWDVSKWTESAAPPAPPATK